MAVSMILVTFTLSFVPHAEPAAEAKIVPLFDGKTLQGWKITDFGGQGEVLVEDGGILLEMGGDMTGVTLEKAEKIPSTNYEVSLKAKRVRGGDFFCGLTFPVQKSHCSLIVGGWGGGLVGLSCIDGRDASNNETSSWHNFDNDTWYNIRLRVQPSRIQAWLDDKRVVNADIKDRAISVRPDVNLSRPFGLSTWRTAALIKDIKIRALTAKEQNEQPVEEDKDS
jgi:hypothetical protein